VSGYYFNNCFKCTPSNEALNEESGRLLWDMSERMIARVVLGSTGAWGAKFNEGTGRGGAYNV